MANNKVALITGITGQDGAYLAQLLLKEGYKVIGLLRGRDNIKTKNLDYLGITSEIILKVCNLLNMTEIINILKQYHPSEIYNLAAQSSVWESFQQPIDTLNFNIISVVSILESIKTTNKNIKFYQASSSEMFGRINHLPLRENSTFNPVSPYGISKASAHWITVNYRESFGLFAISGILFNHESSLRGNNFIVKKIIQTAINIKKRKQDSLEVGNIGIKRDFGYAPKYVEAMYLMMQYDHPDDYIISSGCSLSIRDIIYYVFDKLEISKDRIVINQEYFRPNEIEDIYGDSSKAKLILGWKYDMSFFDVLDLLIKEEELCLKN